MKARINITALLVTIGISLSAQYNDISFIKYGIGSELVQTGSGHGANMNLHFFGKDLHRSFEVGVLMNNQTYQVKGASFRHKWFIGAYNQKLNNINIKPFISYNFIYQSDVAKESVFIDLEGNAYELNEKPGKISTMEHYVGTGISYQLFSRIHVDAQVGFGTYIGSLSKLDTPKSAGMHEFNHGFTTSYKIGLGFVL